MVSHIQEEDTLELAFSDYYEMNGVNVERKRKTSNEFEGEVIHLLVEKTLGRKWEGTLGELKEFIVRKTPFPFHSRALGLD